MVKSELIKVLSEQYPHLRQKHIVKIVDVIFEEISKALQNGNRVELRGFGAFSVRERKARMGRNPRTGEPVQVERKNVPFFRTGKNLREKLNS